MARQKSVCVVKETNWEMHNAFSENFINAFKCNAIYLFRVKMKGMLNTKNRLN